MLFFDSDYVTYVYTNSVKAILIHPLSLVMVFIKSKKWPSPRTMKKENLSRRFIGDHKTYCMDVH